MPVRSAKPIGVLPLDLDPVADLVALVPAPKVELRVMLEELRPYGLNPVLVPALAAVLLRRAVVPPFTPFVPDRLVEGMRELEYRLVTRPGAGLLRQLDEDRPAELRVLLLRPTELLPVRGGTTGTVRRLLLPRFPM